MVSNFSYHINQHLYRPSSITDIITYSGETSIVASPFDGSKVNENFFNLAKSALDNTSRIMKLEGYSNTIESPNVGYVYYNGRKETQGALYGGSPLVLVNSGDTFSVPYTMDAGTKKAFRIAVGDGIVYTSGGSIDTVNSKYHSIVFGEAGNGSPFASTTTLLAYMNGELKWSSKTSTNAFSINGDGNPGGLANWTSTFNCGLTKSFWIYWNDGYQQVINSLATTVGSSVYNAAGDQIGVKCSILCNLGTTPNMSALATTLQNALNAVVPGAPFTLTVSGNNVYISTINSDRANGGIFQVTLVKDVTGDGGSTWGTGILEWLGWTTTPNTSVETFDLSSVIQFTTTGSGPYGLNIVGQNAYSAFALLDQDAALANAGLLASFGLDSYIGLNYHTRHPLTTYSKVLNVGGDLWMRDGYMRDLHVTGVAVLGGGFAMSGTVNFENLNGTGTITTTGNITGAAFSGTSITITGTSALTGTTNINTSGASTTTIGNASGALIVNGVSTFNRAVTIASTLSIGGISINNTSNAITGIASANITTANITTANIANLNFSGNLGVTGTGQIAGMFDSGTTNPAHTNRLNYDGNLYTYGLYAYNNAFFLGSNKVAGSFYGGTQNPSNTNRTNYDGNLHAYTFYMYNTTAVGAGSGLSRQTSDGAILSAASDERLKERIEPIPYGLADVLKLEPVSFYWKEQFSEDRSRNLGLIAQRTIPVIPEVIQGDGQNGTYYGINLDYVVPVLIKAIQELNAKVEMLEGKLTN